MDLTELYRNVKEYGDICDHCLGRLVAKRSYGLSNDMRGRAIRIASALIENVPYCPPTEPCWICNNFFDQTAVWAKRVVAALDGIECRTFLVGSKVPPLIAEAEEMIWSDLSLHDPEPLKSEINREVGKAVSALNGLQVELKTPDVVVVLNVHEEKVEVQIRPIFFYGRYFKYERGIPQTHWHCRSCRGAGCEVCNGTGKQYADSVEELIGRPLCRIFEGTAGTLHGAGREDIDAVMIGSGRPFIIEISEPRIRHADLSMLEEEINRDAGGRVAVKDLRWTERDEVETLKTHKGHKKYRILVDIDGSIPEETLSTAVDQLKGATIHQRTPTRVAHRRADKIRERVVLDIISAGREESLYAIEVTGEAGLYIKELISGDQGRTTPSLSEILGTPARVVQLDVIDVQGTES
jgi:tRNA pseudouridine synthase 10